jgi:type I restriction enzyme S subunit
MTLPRYQQCKYSGVDWLGYVPNHWALSKLKHFTRFCGGGTPSRDTDAFWNGTIPWVSPKDMKVESIWQSEEYITAAGLENSSSTLVPKGRLLMVVRSGILQHTIPIAINEVPVALNQDMKALSFSDDLCLTGFFLRWVQGLNKPLLLAWAKQGATVESIEHSYLSETIVPLPPKREQQIIVDFLDKETSKIDALVREQQALIDLLAEKRRTLISHSVTKGLKKNVPMKSSGVEWLGDVPAHWELCATKRLFRLIVEPAPENNDFELLSIYTDIGVRPRRELEAKGNKATTTDGYWIVRKGDLIVNKLLAWMGAIGISHYNGVTSPAYDILRQRKELEPQFYDYLFRCGICFTEFRRYSRGIMDMRLRLYFDELGQLLMPYPPVSEQRAIVAFLESETERFDLLTEEAERAIALLQERRAALIAAAVTGKIDVRGSDTAQDTTEVAA